MSVLIDCGMANTGEPLYGVCPREEIAMRRTFVAFVPLLLLSLEPAVADRLPVSGIYGTPAACRLFAAGGVDAVIEGHAESVEISDDDPVLLVRPSQLIGREWGCDRVIQREGDKLTLACGVEGTDFQTTGTLKEDRSAGMLDVAFEEFRGTIWRCE